MRQIILKLIEKYCKHNNISLCINWKINLDEIIESQLQKRLTDINKIFISKEQKKAFILNNEFKYFNQLGI